MILKYANMIAEMRKTRKQILKEVRNEMIKTMWEEQKAMYAVEDIAYVFGLKTAQAYRIIKGRKN